MLGTLQWIIISSAYRQGFTGGVVVVTVPLVAIRSKVTLKTDPCGTPFGCQLFWVIASWFELVLGDFVGSCRRNLTYFL